MSYLDPSEQKSRLASVVKIAGPRYDTRVNLTLPISFTFDVLGRTEALNKKLLALNTRIWEEGRYLGRSKPYELAKVEYDELLHLLKLIGGHLKDIRDSKANHEVRWGLLNNKVKRAEDLAEEILRKLYAAKDDSEPKPTPGQSDDVKTEINEIYRLTPRLRELAAFTTTPAIKALTKNAVLITGQAGSGKTHLLCDTASKRLDEKLPTHIFLGEEFASGDPLARMVQLMGARGASATVFKKIDDDARGRNTKALVIIDAINEASGKVTWEKLSELKQYKNIALVISVRSGFEKSVLSPSFLSSLTKIEHEGFGELDWQAVTNFFALFGIPLPKVPIIAPEFRNPLFLKLFCETYKRSRVFTGHLGTTKLFEAYNKKQGAAVLADMSLPADATRIWKRIIKPVAQWMADHGEDRILESGLVRIIESEFPGRAREVLRLLQRHWLLTKVPHYTRNGTVRGHEYRFPYQKFSDHLIARCLLTTHLKNKATPERYFKPGTKLGDIVCKGWNYGLIEALSIQVPERLDGKDLAWVMPEEFRGRDPILKGFMQSVVWRNLEIKNSKHKYFDQKSALDYANTYIIPDNGEFPEFLNVLLSISGLPDHPLNAKVLNKYMRQFTMANRDVFWQEYLTYGYDDLSMIKRLIDWAWYRESKQYIADESLLLIAIPLIWFLAASNRLIRDRATKALIELLKRRENVLVDLLKLFDDVNDPYVKQRLHAVAYGCALRSESTNNLKLIATHIYKSIFKNGKPPADILLRDYARSTVELYYKQRPGASLNPSLFRPPYNSQWPSRVPSAASLQARYREEEDVRKDYSSIWSSLMYGQGGGIADFGNYVVNSNLNHFTGYPIAKTRPLSEREQLKEFEALLTKSEAIVWETVRNTSITRIVLVSFLNSKGKEIGPPVTPEAEAAASAAVEEFKSKVLAKKKYEKYRPVVLKSIAGDRLQGHDRFDTSRAQRWILDRVIKLGWSPKKHGEYDRLVSRSGPVSRDRNNNERIGKKYQWIALHEFLAYVADNFLLDEMLDDGTLQTYQGPWQLSIRDIDPTHTIAKTGDKKPSDESWWTPENYRNWNQIPKIAEWLKSAADLPDFSKMLQVTDSNGITWLNLKGYYTWEEPMNDVEDSRLYDVRHKQVWAHVYGYVIDKDKREEFYEWAKTQDFWNKWMPESSEFYRMYYGEYPDSEAFRSMDTPYYGGHDWIEPSDTPRDKQCPIRLLVANDEYGQEGNTNDRSIEEGFSIQIPTRNIYKAMDLKTGLNNGEYIVRSTGEVAFKDPSVSETGTGVLLANKELFTKFLDDNNLTIVWTVVGEKLLIGGHREDFSGRLRVNGAYTIDSDTPKGSYNIIIESPPPKKSPQQPT